MDLGEGTISGFCLARGDWVIGIPARGFLAVPLDQ